MDVEQREALLRRTEQAGVEPDDLRKIRAVFESYAYLAELIDHKNISLARLRKLLFGPPSEKTADVLGRCEPSAADTNADDAHGRESSTAVTTAETPVGAAQKPPAQRPGHGRHGVDDYPGATRIAVRHESLESGDRCPECRRGTVYQVSQPGVLIRFVGQAPIGATVYELQKLRCQLCGQMFTADPPAGVGAEKYDASVASMIGLFKYGSGLPFNRLDRLQGNLKIPLPASTQWDLMQGASPNLEPAYEELVRQAAQGEVLHNDDTTVKILELMGKRAKQRALLEAADDGDQRRVAKERTGLFTSGVVATRAGRRIALFFSGRQHAGENLQAVLRQRAAELPPPIQMCDALSRNLSGELATIVAHCLAHGRRQFVDLTERFPEECRYVLEALEAVYRHDAETRKQQLSPADRLAFHQAHSGPVMESLRAWLRRQSEEKLVEPNSGLGAAIAYLRKHWDQLTLFLRTSGAPLDNNVCERALKKAILHRKNALFYKTQHGARVGDLYMSLIYSCELNDANPFDYLNQLQRHAAEVAAAPENWLPWNYRAPLTALAPAASVATLPATG